MCLALTMPSWDRTQATVNTSPDIHSHTESRYPSLTSHQRIGRPCSQRASTMSSSRKLGEMTSRVHSVSVAPQLSQKIQKRLTHHRSPRLKRTMRKRPRLSDLTKKRRGCKNRVSWKRL